MIKKFLLGVAMAVSLGAGAQPVGTATYSTEGVLEIKFPTEDSHMITYRFEKCMANNLYTFSRVFFDGYTVNSAQYSDNIGPFSVVGLGWVGGNHLSGTAITAETKSVKIEIDGEELTENISDRPVQRVDIYVENDIYNFADESMHYIVMGNSIQVEGSHKYTCTTNKTVDRYYGMQSMFEGETAILTPQGHYPRWTQTAKVSQFTKGAYPDFSLFVERSARCHQAAYMTRDGIGDRHMVKDADVVFIGNSYGKSYHKTMGSAVVKPGDETYWKGVYTWFKTPEVNASDDNAGEFVYDGFFDGKEARFRVSDNEKASVQIAGGVESAVVDDAAVKIASAAPGEIVIGENFVNASVYAISGRKIAAGAGSHNVASGIYIVTDGAGHVQKLIVK